MDNTSTQTRTNTHTHRCQFIMPTSAVHTESTLVLHLGSVSVAPALRQKHTSSSQTSVSITAGFAQPPGFLDICFVGSPRGGSSHPPSRKTHAPESRCEAPNWTKHPGVRTNERGRRREPQRAGNLTWSPPPWDPVSTVEPRRKEK